LRLKAGQRDTLDKQVLSKNRNIDTSWKDPAPKWQPAVKDFRRNQFSKQLQFRFPVMSAPSFHRTPSTIAQSLVLMTVISISATTAILWLMAAGANEKAAIDANRLVNTAVAGWRDRISIATRDYAYWEEAFVAVTTRNEAEVYLAIGVGAEAGTAFDMATVLDETGSPLYGWQAHGTVASDLSILPEPIAALFHGALQAKPIGQESVVSGFSVIDGQLTLLATANISPYAFDGMARDDFPTLLIGLKVGDDMVAELQSQLLLDDVRVEAADAPPGTGRDITVLKGPDGKAVASLTWTKPRPGSEILHRLSPMLTLVGSIILFLSFWTGRKSFRQAHQILECRHAAWSAARSDGLTGLLNRTGFHELANEPRIQSALRLGHVALVFIDLNRFKAINDSAGHEAGDIALDIMARRMHLAGRDFDDFARLGGDEFVALLIDPAPENAARGFADRLLRECQVPVRLGKEYHLVHAAIGIAASWDENDTLNDLLNRADAAMYVSKDSVTPAITVYSHDIDRVQQRRRLIETGLRNHIARAADGKSGFNLVFQPIIDRTTDAIASAETLLRWTDEELGSVLPDEFIPVAEASNLIQPIGEIVLRCAVEALKSCPALKISVNISPIQLVDKSFPHRLIALLKNNEISPERMLLEITETALIEVPEVARTQILHLRSAGFEFALDDFGTGFASISYLKRFPFKVLKIDRSFVSNIGTNPHSDLLFQSIVQMGRAFSLDVVAEGVEEIEQSNLIRMARCTLEQGYLHARPMTLDELQSRYFARDGRLSASQ
jgi:diguanylate cyclase (GGDEF)-like protein